MTPHGRTPEAALRLIKVAHTVAWVVFASATVAIIPALVAGHRRAALWLSGLVAMECMVLAMNRMRCPLTHVAARFTDDRRENFDIYLPLWLARHNKTLFGSLFAVDLVAVALQWAR